ncbi:MAG: hypothetical protein EZS28_045408, partial [Streblomastix strix]
EVEIEEGEQFVNFIRFQLAEWWAWVVPPIVVGSLTLVISGIVYMIWKDRYEKNKQVEHLKELQQQKEKRQQKLEEINRMDKDLQVEDGDNNTMIITEEDEVKTQLPKVNLTESQSSIHFVSLRNAQQQTQSQILLDSELESKSSSTLPIKQKSHLQINPRDDEQFADVMKVIDKVSQSSSQSETNPSILQLELLLQTLENKQPIKEKHPLATFDSDTKINKSSTSLHKQKPKHHSSSQSKATFTGFLEFQEAPDIDFSLISSDSPELERVVWGPSGPPATLSLAKFGIFVPTPEILQLQRRQSMINDQVDKPTDEQNNGRSIPNIQQKVQEKEQL